MTEEEKLFIENNRYTKYMTLLALPTGRIAVLYPNKQYFMVVNTLEQAIEVSAAAWVAYTRVTNPAYQTVRALSKKINPKIDEDELDKLLGL